MPYFGVHDPFFESYKGIIPGVGDVPSEWDVIDRDEDCDSLDLRIVAEIHGERYFERPSWVISLLEIACDDIRLTDRREVSGEQFRTYAFRYENLRYLINESLTCIDEQGAIWTFEVHFDDVNCPL